MFREFRAPLRQSAAEERARNLSLPRRRLRYYAMAASALVLASTAIADTTASATTTAPQIEVVSNRADLVSGGDALVEVKPPEGVSAHDVRVTLDGRDVTDESGVRPNGRYMGVVAGLRPGTNELVARVARNSAAKLTITNFSKQGPIFAGEQVRPWICETQHYGLGPASGNACVASTRYDYFYKSTATNQFEVYDPASPPAGALVAKTTTDQGKTVPYVVRRERGVIDRGIYDIAVLYQPAKGWEPWASQPQWNGKVHWLFEGDCNPGHRQAGGASTGTSLNGYRSDISHGPPDVLNSFLLGDYPLSRGYAVATSSLNRLGANCNDVVSAEATMMIKEHFIEAYGPIRFTTSDGCSGGSMQQHLIAANYPGLLDGILPACSFPDLWSIAEQIDDCKQLNQYFSQTSPEMWTNISQRAAVTGTPADAVCQELTPPIFTFAESWFDPEIGCTTNNNDRISGATEPDWVYDTQTNPAGVRCTVTDYQSSIFGHRNSDGFANRPLDNVGVQYGLAALRHGQITPEQFVDLNVKLGGRDIDYHWTTKRTQADTDGVRNAYRSGRINDGHQLASVPIIDLRGSSGVEPHQDVYTQATRARLIAANGTAGNQVSWVSLGIDKEVIDPTMVREAFNTLDQWLTAIHADTSDNSLAAKVLRNRPTQAKDTCWLNGQPGLCGSNLPYYSTPRMVAGESVAMDTVKCQLKPVDWTEYSVGFSDTQKRQLHAAFPDGVCDWTKPGLEQQPPAGVWQSFATSVGGSPLGAAPRSVPVNGKG